ncbi:hypothetical protein J2125_003289 [Erwinia toletana]|uniref:Uncharacterized protein n=1 Tax=Winslowiella toletana TaxID=92490 RepID=A0ABS4PBV6_9GAMM|nr:hypothetical protein [Winslowiella toletana]MBP2170097.1 hypothetical protein [Winslowiella toletana]
MKLTPVNAANLDEMLSLSRQSGSTHVTGKSDEEYRRNFLQEIYGEMLAERTRRDHKDKYITG